MRLKRGKMEWKYKTVAYLPDYRAEITVFGKTELPAVKKESSYCLALSRLVFEATIEKDFI